MGAAPGLDVPPGRALTAPRLQRLEILVNPRAGHAGFDAGRELERLAAEFSLDCRVRTPGPDEFWTELRSAVDAAPDLMVTLAGDGTARAAASLCGPDGPLLAPLAGGTMNMLSHALYGPADWRTAFRDALETGLELPVSGGEVDGQRFYVAAILGEPALWAEAREAARLHKLELAWRMSRHAWRRAFSHRIRFSLDKGPEVKTLALTLMCPLVSKAMHGADLALEATRLDPQGVADVLRLGAHAALSRIVGDWRNDPSVGTRRCRTGRAWSGGAHLRAILDGEPMKLHKSVEINFMPLGFRALAPAARIQAIG
ncbi:MAG TPA: diacylglycerol kinase family protein [Caulobacteraceae bacterium]|jgi:diacylglycerol kinase family enzyme|nr:diacylglycerol kinase family protein [Caulobacteraceae bacterium]